MTNYTPAQHTYHMHHPRCIFTYTGIVLRLCGLLMLGPLLALFTWPELWTQALGFVVPAAGLLILGTLMRHLVGIRQPSPMTMQEGAVIVVLSWSITSVLSALPFMMIERLSFTHAIFEAVSGWTTTGLSVVDVSTASPLILLWRSLMQLAGGAGLAIIMLASITGPVGTGLAAAEGRQEQLVAHIRTSVRLVMVIYSSYALAGVVAFRAVGLSLFEAVNHSFAAVSTGGFSTQTLSIGSWDSAAVEAVAIPLMLMGNINFLTAYALLRGKLSTFARSGEIRLLSLLTPTCVLALLLVSAGLYPTMHKAIRVALFEPLSALTTTGFSLTTYTNWPSVGILIIIALMLIGGGAGSTAGGIKQFRVYVLIKSVWWRLRAAFLPRTAVVQNYVWQGERRNYVGDEQVAQVAVFAFLYLCVCLLTATIIAAHGYQLAESLFEAASALGTVGLSMGVTSPDAPPLVLATLTLSMFLGRLEFFVIAVGVWKILRDTLGILTTKRR